MSQNSWLHRIPDKIGYYLAGFTDGEGSFNVSLVKRDDYILGWKVVIIFNISQRDKTVLALFKKHLGCGRYQYRADGVWYYIVSNPKAVIERVIPFFKRFSFLSASKKTNFSIFQKIARIIANGGHYTEDGLRQIVVLREQLNKGRGRKRKYELHHYQQSLTKNPQRLHARVKYRPKHLG